MRYLSLIIIQDRIVEWIKYDCNYLKYPFVMFARLIIWIYRIVGNDEKAFKVASSVYRTGWPGSYELGIDIANHYFVKMPESGRKLIRKTIDTIPALDRTKKFFDDPSLMINGIVQVLKSPSDNEKGAIILNYSYYFVLFLKLYDINKIIKKYNIILEPSWAGYCDLSILAYSLLDVPIFVQVYEDRDKKFLRDLGRNIVPIDVGPSWFVNHKKFVPPLSEAKRNIDIVMVAGWAKFKRHNSFFKSLSGLLKQGYDISVVLVGYPVDMNKEQIKELANYYGVLNCLTIYEWIDPEEVAEIYKKSKINILWSKFEGNNRAIIEGMFCDTPVILREGHNYAQVYDFINSKTGCFASEKNFHEVVIHMLRRLNCYAPRTYVMEKRNCILATKIMSNVLREQEERDGHCWTNDLKVKVNELHGMKYLDTSDELLFKYDHDLIKNYIR